ncbi:MAG: homoserine dehydrogenase [Andreesenia angusta]|nr:homoserine dehydrogenase [Andreesenia angusta]
MVNIGLLGLGTVGSGVFDIVKDRNESLKKSTGKNINISKILVRDASKNRNLDIDNSILTENVDDILNDDSIDIIVEVIGGIDLAYEYIKTALSKGKSVVTANKAVISLHLEELNRLAKENNCGLLYEASVAGGIPIIKGLNEALRINKIDNIEGILNGTTNFILTKMYDDNLSFEEALDLAHEYGYAEADPTDDIEGYDAARKISILASLAFDAKASIDDVECHGISSIKASDIKRFKEIGLAPKLLGCAIKKNNEFSLTVEPILVDDTSLFSAVKDAFNAVNLDCDIVGDLQFYGQGAGKLPTGNAVVSDIIDIINEDYKKFDYCPNPDIVVGENSLFEGLYYFRASLDENDDKKIIKAFEDKSIDIKYEVQDQELVILTEMISSELIANLITEDLKLPAKSYSYLRIESEVLNSLVDISF